MCSQMAFEKSDWWRFLDPSLIYFFPNFLIFVNFDMFPFPFLGNCYEKMDKYILNDLKQVVTVGINQFHFLCWLP